MRLIRCFTLVPFLTFGCGDPPTSPPPAKQEPALLTSFSFTKAANGTPVDGIGTIDGQSVTVFLPPGTNRTALKATFTASAGTTVLVNGVEQASGTSANDFTGPVTYTVRASDNSTTTYSVALTTDIATIDQVMTNFMAKHNAPGLSLAITKDGNLVYAKAYGKADDERPAVATDLFRIASLSKPITSAAIMRLVDQGKLTLGQKVFGEGAILGTTYGTDAYGAGITSITVDHLLHHTAGGWANDGADPMFTNPTMTADELITWTLNKRPLTSVPGATYAYSNFGYCVLGRVIEKITGQSYENAVKTLVLQPLGITDMVIAGNTLADRRPNEVKYYGQNGQNPYGFNVSRMDAHGGWAATATDIARFLVGVDGLASKPDILSSSAITQMVAPSTANANYAAGWSVNGANWWHLGLLIGSGAALGRTTSQGMYNFVILTNTGFSSNVFLNDLDALFWSARAATPRWPTYDLFQ